MTQRLISLFITLWMCLGNFAIAAPSPAGQISKTPEASFQKGLDCLKQSDLDCARLALNSIPNQSIYAKLLDGNIAIVENDVDRAFRLLLPLTAQRNLPRPASASLHSGLALAYEKQPDPFRALEQRVMLEHYLSPQHDNAVLLDNQRRILALLAQVPHNELINMRGDSLNTTMQGWIDLALALKTPGGGKQAFSSWRTAYPDIALTPALARELEQTSTSTTSSSTQPTSRLQGPIALMLPFAVDEFYPAADAIERGFVAAQTALKGDGEIKIYATRGDSAEINTLYQQALSEGSQYVIGPLTRNEVTALAATPRPVPTLALNEPEAPDNDPNLYALGLSVEAEAAQVARLARRSGMQTATIVASDNPLGSHMANAFSQAWVNEGGQIKLQVVITRMPDLEDLKRQVDTQPTDMIFLAADAAEARAMRPHLDIATPTFALSHVYSGLPHDPLDQPLLAVRFVDMPWLLAPDDAAFAPYKEAAAGLPPGKMQRWFALGVDAYQLLLELARKPNTPFSLQGLTGRIDVSALGEINRELAVGSFGPSGVILENSP